MAKYTIISDDNYKGLYIDGKKVLDGHQLYPEDIIRAITGEDVDCVDYFDFEEDEFTWDEESNTQFANGKPWWINGVGFPEELQDYWNED